MSSTKWGDKLQNNFSILSETSSKESIQTFVKWIYFNRKHKTAFIDAFRNYITQKTQSKSTDHPIYTILLTVLHEILILHHGTKDKWELAHDLRIAFGESLILDYALLFPQTKLETCMQLWDTYNVFDGPTLLHQIRTKLTSASASASAIPSTSTSASTTSTTHDATAAAATCPTAVASSATATTDDVVIAAAAAADTTTSAVEAASTTPQVAAPAPQPLPKSTDNATEVIEVLDDAIAVDDDESDVVVIEEKSSKPTSLRLLRKMRAKNSLQQKISEPNEDNFDILDESLDSRSPPTTKENFVYDFDATGIPPKTIRPEEFVVPCRLIATLQIARDLRNDSTVQLSSMLETLPESVRTVIADVAEMDDPSSYELPDEVAREFVTIVNDQLLDLDMDDQLENVTTFIDLVQRQREARQTMYKLLIQSRCQFGANEVAEAYFDINDTVLKQRAQILADAMDLEGLEVQPVAVSAMAALEAELAPLSWYNQQSSLTDDGPMDDESLSKRQKI